MAQQVRCPKCWKRVPETARFCRRCGYGLKRVASPACRPCAAVPLLVSGLGLAAGMFSLGWLVVPAPPPTPVSAVRAEPPSPVRPYIQWAGTRHHRIIAHPAPVRWPTAPEFEPVVIPPPPELPSPYRTRYVTPPRPRAINPYLYGRPANPYFYPSPDPQDPQR